MNEEEKEAIKLLKSMMNHKPDNIRLNWRKGIYALQLILNLIEKQDKIITLLLEDYSAGEISNPLEICSKCNYNNEDCHGDYCTEALKKLLLGKCD